MPLKTHAGKTDGRALDVVVGTAGNALEKRIRADRAKRPG